MVKRLSCLVSLIASAALVLASSAQGAAGVFERTWGLNVDMSLTGTGFEICTVAASCQIGGVSGAAGAFNGPGDVARDAAGNIYVADTGNHRIQKFDALGNWERTWGSDVDSAGGGGAEVCTVAIQCQAGLPSGTQGGEFNNPGGVAVNSAGNVFVADTGRNRIQKFDSLGNFIEAWGKDVDNAGGGGFAEICESAATCQAGGTATAQGGEFNSPRDVATDNGTVFVADASSDRIQRLSAFGVFQSAWGKDVDDAGGGGHGEICTVAADCQAGASSPSEGREFSDPNALVVDAGYVWVADTGMHRIQKLEPNGVFHRAWGRDVSTAAGDGFEVCIDVAATCQAGASGTAGGEFNLPDGIAGDPTGDVYVSDRNNHRIQRFGSFGTWQRAWGKNVDMGGALGFEVCTVAASCQAGSFTTALGGELDSPGGLASDPAGNLYVADRLNSRIQRFADPPAPPGTTPTTPAPPKKKCKKGRKLKKGKCVKKKRKKKKK